MGQPQKEFTASVNKIAVMKHIYTVGVNEEEKLYVVEEFFSLLETKIQPYLKRLSNGENVQQIESVKKLLSIFIATLLMRNPRMLNKMLEIKNKNHPIHKSFPEETKNILKDKDDEFMQIIFNRSLVDKNNKVSKELFTMKWCLIHSPTGEFVTTDNPVSVYHPTESEWGVGTDGAHIHLAISASYMLFIGHDIIVLENETHSMPKEGVDGFNAVIIEQAHRYIISGNSFDNIRELINEQYNRI